ncbi:MAG: hypothetical protein R3E97_08580 [Candidatus Eisenbacteria bacterium]
MREATIAITKVEVTLESGPVVPEHGPVVKAHARMELGGIFWIRGLQVVEAGDGLRVTFPGENRRQREPGLRTVMDVMAKCVLDAYWKKVAE